MEISYENNCFETFWNKLFTYDVINMTNVIFLIKFTKIGLQLFSFVNAYVY